MRVNVLDHGYVILRNISGPTRRIILSEASGFDDASFIPEEYRDFDADDTDPARTSAFARYFPNV